MSQTLGMCHTVCAPVMSNASAQNRRLHTMLPRPGASLCGTSPFLPSRSRGRRKRNHSATHSRPVAPTTMNAVRHVPFCVVMRYFMICGVSTAPMEAPLCNTLLPIVRSFSLSSAKVVFSAHGQWPASKNPSNPRHTSNPVKPCENPETTPMIDQHTSTAGYRK